METNLWSQLLGPSHHATASMGPPARGLCLRETLTTHSQKQLWTEKKGKRVPVRHPLDLYESPCQNVTVVENYWSYIEFCPYLFSLSNSLQPESRQEAMSTGISLSIFA